MTDIAEDCGMIDIRITLPKRQTQYLRVAVSTFDIQYMNAAGQEAWRHYMADRLAESIRVAINTPVIAR